MQKIPLSTLYTAFKEKKLSKAEVEVTIKKLIPVNPQWSQDHLHKLRQLFTKYRTLEDTRFIISRVLDEGGFVQPSDFPELPPTLLRKINTLEPLIAYAD